MKKQLTHSSASRVLAFVLTLLCLASFTNVCAFAANSGSLGSSSVGSQWTASADTSIFWVETSISNKSDEALVEQIKLFASELQAKGCTTDVLDIKYSADASLAGHNDIIINLSSEHGITAQGFEIQLPAEGCIIINASDADGLFYGCRFVIQQLILNNSTLVVGETYTDAPDTLERGLHLDCGRKYYTVDWIKNMIRELSWANMNTIYLHFSEEMGLGLALEESYFSDEYKWLADVAGRDLAMCTQAIISESDLPDYNSVLTTDDMREIAEVADLYHVEIVPSFDSPGHLNYLIHEYHKEYGQAYESDYNLSGVTYGQTTYGIGNYFVINGWMLYLVEGSNPSGGTADQYSRCLNLAADDAREFGYELYSAYGKFFREIGCTKFDIGGDELLGWGTIQGVNRWQALPHWDSAIQTITGNSNAVAYDLFLYYLNEVYDLVTELGFEEVRMWNDDALRTADTGWTGVVQLDENFIINYWTNPYGSPYYNSLEDYAKKYRVINYLQNYNYFVLNSGYNGAGATAEEMYNEWSPYVDILTGSTAASNISSAYYDQVLGGAYAIWSDIPSWFTEEEVLAQVIDPMRANGAKCWDCDANSSVSYSTYAANWNTIGDAPANLQAAGDIVTVYDTAELEAAIDAYYANYSANAQTYTTTSFAAYTQAVEAAEALLASSHTQTDIDSALADINEAISSLVVKPLYDSTAIDGALALFDSCDGDAYTSETYGAYRQLAEEARAYINSNEDIVQERVDAYASRLEFLSGELVLLTNVSESKYVYSIASNSHIANLNKYFLFAVGVDIDCDIDIDNVDIRIYDDLNQRMDVVKIYLYNQTENRYMFHVKFRAEDLGYRTYTAYVLDKNGQRSSNSLSLTLLVF